MSRGSFYLFLPPIRTELVVQTFLVYRMAYGAPRISCLQNPEAVRGFMTLFVPRIKSYLPGKNWRVGTKLFGAREGIGKLLLNLGVVALDCLPQGGGIKTIVDTTGAWIEATGTGARIQEHTQTIIQGGLGTIPLEGCNGSLFHCAIWRKD